MMNSFAEIIDKFTVPVLAQILGVDESHVRVMKARNSVPPEYWGVLIEAGPGHGLPPMTHAQLRQLRTLRFQPERQAS